MIAAKPSLDVVRALTDEHVLRALMEAPALTRAELASRTGISKPTMSESVRRLADAGLLEDTGERTVGRGRIGTYYALRPGIGTALVLDIAPGRVVAESVDPHGTVLAHHEGVVPPRARTKTVTRVVVTAAHAVLDRHREVRLAVVSVADPVDRRTGSVVRLPDAPFLVGTLAPVGILQPLVRGPVLVDNDVNWAARAEHDLARGALENFAYLYLGEGTGCAVVADGQVLRGHHGTAGEVAHVLVPGPGGMATPFIDVFGALGLRREKSTAVDTPRLLASVAGDAHTRDTVAAAVAGLIAALVGIADPERVILGGPWGSDPRLVEAVRSHVRQQPRHLPVHQAAVTNGAALDGARSHAVTRLRDAIVALAHADDGIGSASPDPRP